MEDEKRKKGHKGSKRCGLNFYGFLTNITIKTKKRGGEEKKVRKKSRKTST